MPLNRQAHPLTESGEIPGAPEAQVRIRKVKVRKVKAPPALTRRTDPSKVGQVHAPPLGPRSHVPKQQVTIPQTVWRALTPWVEERGETVVSYYKSALTRDTQPPVVRQAQLRSQYGAERNAPLWSRLLFGQSIVKDRQGNYSPVLAGFPPDVGLGKADVVVRTARKVITLPKVVPPDPKKVAEAARHFGKVIDWDKMATEIANGRIKNAADARRWAARQPTKQLPFGPDAPPSPRSAPPTQADVQKAIDAFNKAVQSKKTPPTTRTPIRPPSFAAAPVPFTLPSTRTPASEWRPFRPGQLTKARMELLLNRWRNISPNRAVQEMNQSNLIAVAVAASPKITVHQIRMSSPTVRDRALRNTSAAFRNAVEEGTSSEARTAAKTEVKESTKQAQKQARQEKTRTQPARKTAPAKATATTTGTAAPPRAAAATPPPPAAPSSKGRPAGAPSLKFALPSVRIKTRMDAMTPAEREGVVAWKQGIVYVVVFPPYQTKRDIFYVTKAPLGVKIYPNATRAYQTVQTISGDRPPGKPITHVMGFQRITVTAPSFAPGRKGAIKFRQIPEKAMRGGYTYNNQPPGTLTRHRRRRR